MVERVACPDEIVESAGLPVQHVASFDRVRKHARRLPEQDRLDEGERRDGEEHGEERIDPYV